VNDARHAGLSSAVSLKLDTYRRVLHLGQLQLVVVRNVALHLATHRLLTDAAPGRALTAPLPDDVLSKLRQGGLGVALVDSVGELPKKRGRVGGLRTNCAEGKREEYHRQPRGQRTSTQGPNHRLPPLTLGAAPALLRPGIA
jgi:hypothetical protein